MKRENIPDALKETLDEEQNFLLKCLLCQTDQLACNFHSCHNKSLKNSGDTTYENLIRACRYCNNGYNKITRKRGMGTRNMLPWLKETYPDNYNSVIKKYKEWGKDIIEYDGRYDGDVE